MKKKSHPLMSPKKITLRTWEAFGLVMVDTHFLKFQYFLESLNFITGNKVFFIGILGSHYSFLRKFLPATRI